MERPKLKEGHPGPFIKSPDDKSASDFLMRDRSINSMQLHQLAKKAASTCVGGVLSSNAFFEAFDKLKKPFKIQAPVQINSSVENTLSCDEEIGNQIVVFSENPAKEDQNNQDATSSISHLLDIGKFDMLEKPKTEKKWGKLSLAVKEKTVAVAAAKPKRPVETVDPTDLLLFYYSKHRNPIW
jgi:hypothetical protein